MKVERFIQNAPVAVVHFDGQAQGGEAFESIKWLKLFVQGKQIRLTIHKAKINPVHAPEVQMLQLRATIGQQRQIVLKAGETHEMR
jgi:hypothetical protein